MTELIDHTLKMSSGAVTTALTCMGMCFRRGSTATRTSVVAVTTMVLMKPTILSQLSLWKDWMNSIGTIRTEVPPTAAWKLLMPATPAPTCAMLPAAALSDTESQLVTVAWLW